MSDTGFRIFKRVERPERALIEAFRSIPVANIGDEMHRGACMAARIAPCNRSPLLGPAFTVRTRAGDNLLLHRAIDMAEPGDVIVVDGGGDLAHALIGELMASWAERRGIAGLVVDGALRDRSALAELAMPVYAAGTQPNGPFKHGPGEINVPVCCGGRVVEPGDILAGDADGVVVIKPRDAAAIAERARAKLAAENTARAAIRDGRWNRDAFSEAALAELGCEIIDAAWRGD